MSKYSIHGKVFVSNRSFFVAIFTASVLDVQCLENKHIVIKFYVVLTIYHTSSHLIFGIFSIFSCFNIYFKQGKMEKKPKSI